MCHAEIVGEGIEYIWGPAKNKYRQASLCEKKQVESFKNLVNKCLSRNWLTTERVRRCALRARCYSCAYWEIHFGNNETAVDDSLSVPIRIRRIDQQLSLITPLLATLYGRQVMRWKRKVRLLMKMWMMSVKKL